jgi:hypothetical protein
MQTRSHEHAKFDGRPAIAIINRPKLTLKSSKLCMPGYMSAVVGIINLFQTTVGTAFYRSFLQHKIKILDERAENKVCLKPRGIKTDSTWFTIHYIYTKSAPSFG